MVRSNGIGAEQVELSWGGA